MTIKKRLAVSNVIMIVLPVIITLIIEAVSIGAVYLSICNKNGFGFSSNEDFYELSQTVSAHIEEALERNDDNVLYKLDIVCNILDKKTTALVIMKDGSEFYTYGETAENDSTLISSVNQLNEDGFSSSASRQVYHHTSKQKSGVYEIYLFGKPSYTNYESVETTIIICEIMNCLGIILSIVFTNGFLTNSIFKRIETPLDELSKGVTEISNGNLDYRIDYDKNDEFKPICEDFNSMAVRLKESVELTKKNEESRKKLLLNISHDLRSPLTSIQAYVEGLLDGVASDTAMRHKYLETIKRKAIDIDNMVSQLFAYSKLDLQTATTETQRVDLAKETVDIINAVAEEYKEKGLCVSVKGEPVSVRINTELLYRIVTNLFDNSVKYKNKESANMEITIEKSGDFAHICFSDNGPGVDEKELTKIFDVFYRTDTARNNPGDGSGIGLAFVKSAVENMNGTVRAYNQNGLTVEIIFPVVKENEQNIDY